MPPLIADLARIQDLRNSDSEQPLGERLGRPSGAEGEVEWGGVGSREGRRAGWLAMDSASGLWVTAEQMSNPIFGSIVMKW